MKLKARIEEDNIRINTGVARTSLNHLNTTTTVTASILRVVSYGRPTILGKAY